MIRLALVASFLCQFAAAAADLTKVDRSIAKEPVYKTKAPRYALLVFGPEAKDRVWLIKDGDTLYVDRNGNGDLTEAGEKIAAEKGGSAGEGYRFTIDQLTIGGKTHHNLQVGAGPLRSQKIEAIAKRPETISA